MKSNIPFMAIVAMSSLSSVKLVLKWPPNFCWLTLMASSLPV
ncbi:hypothetical protein N9383_06465 [Granulosicoccus sp.]|nr:hypothetical protein [Granulosicoccus sp.]